MTAPDRSLKLHLLRGLAWALSLLGRCQIWLMYDKDLGQPLLPCAARCAVDIGLASVDDLHQVASMVEHEDPQQVPQRLHIFRQRVAGGSHCFVARVDAAIVASNWIRVASAVGVDGVEMDFGADEIYTTDAYTTPAWRGLGIHTALNYAMLAFAQQHGFKTAYTMLRITNTASWVTMPRVGWQHAGSLLIFRPAWLAGHEIWHAWGCVYPMPASRPPAPVPSLPDLSGYDQHMLVSDRPWSKTYRLEKDGQAAFLKIVAQERASILRASEILADAYPSFVPEVIACDHQRMGWLLTRDHQGKTIGADADFTQRLMMLDTLASLQLRSARDQRLQAALPAIDIAQIWPRLLAFLRDDRQAADESGRVGAAWLIGAEEAAAAVLELTRCEAVMQAHLAAAKRLPRGLEPGHLRLSDVAIVNGNRCVLCNWAAGCWGPVGLSLFTLITGALPTCRPAEGAADALADGSPDSILLDSYVRALASSDMADAGLLRATLPASLAIGLIRYLTSFADYPSDDPAHHQLMAGELRSGLAALLALAARLSSPKS